MKKTFFFLLLLVGLTSYGQLENSNWHIGHYFGLNFPSTTANPTILSNTGINTSEACASVSNAAGQVLFYSDGVTIFNRNNAIMETGLLGNTSSSQGAHIVPKPDSSNIYYLLTGFLIDGSLGAYYTTIDMTLNGGLGGVVSGQKNIPLKDENGSDITSISTEKVTSISHCSIDHTWVVIEYVINNQPRFYSYKVDNNGISTTPVVSMALTNTYGTSGNIKISPNGEKLAVASSISSLTQDVRKVDLYSFNLATGSVSSGLNIYTGTTDYPYGVEFSQDSSNLYFTTSINLFQQRGANQSRFSFGRKTSFLQQYNVGTKTLALIHSTGEDTMKGIQRAINGKIYVTSSGPQMSVINNPNGIGTACNFGFQTVSLGTNGCPVNLPQWVYKPGIFNGKWVLNLGNTHSNYHGRNIQDIVTDDNGNIYVVGSHFENESTDLAAISPNHDFNAGLWQRRVFVAKFNACKELIGFKVLPYDTIVYEGHMEIDNNNGIYVFLDSNPAHDNVYKLNTNLDIVWSHKYSQVGTTYNRGFGYDKVTNRLYITGYAQMSIDGVNVLPAPPASGVVEPLIVRISPATGLVENNSYYHIDLPANITGDIRDIRVHNNSVYISGEIFSYTTSGNLVMGGLSLPMNSIGSAPYINYQLKFMAKLDYNGSTFTPTKLIENDALRLEYNTNDNSLYTGKFMYHHTNIQSIVSQNDRIQKFDSNLNLVGTRNFGQALGDMKFDAQQNSLYVASYANQASPVILRKFTADLNSEVWAASDSFGATDNLTRPQIHKYQDYIYMNGYYKSATGLTQSNLPQSVGDADYFILRVKDNGTTSEYKTAAPTVLAATRATAVKSLTTNDAISAYPNPFNDVLTLRLPEVNEGVYIVVITDLKGARVLTQEFEAAQELSVNTSNLPKGLYVLRLADKQGVIYTAKIMK